jgi:hypothetical protein
MGAKSATVSNGSLAKVERADRVRGRVDHDGVAVRCGRGHLALADGAAGAARFSITSVWPMLWPILSAMARAMMSVVLPAAKGTITRIGLFG